MLWQQLGTRLGGISSVLLLAGVLGAPAAQADEAALARQVQALTQRVRSLEETVQKLQDTCSAKPAIQAPGPSAAPSEARRGSIRGPNGQYQAEPWDIKEKWGGLHNDMTGKEVTALLGAPSRKFTLNGSAVWYYDYRGVGVGSVMLGKDGRIVGWQRPPVGWW